eukprot:GHVS01047945.1.p1 GENE.GHVS01047945.1~~GHVS01047945.1.p1  ORF type:complete len:289 (+),score=40.73 GHVS01047945.1:252-1118(+)
MVKTTFAVPPSLQSQYTSAAESSSSDVAHSTASHHFSNRPTPPHQDCSPRLFSTFPFLCFPSQGCHPPSAKRSESSTRCLSSLLEEPAAPLSAPNSPPLLYECPPPPHRVPKDPLVYVSEAHGRLLFRSSWFLSLPGMLALALGSYDLGAFSTAVFVSSVNHWRKPRLDWRRFLDILIVVSSILYHAIILVHLNLKRIPQGPSTQGDSSWTRSSEHQMVEAGGWARSVWFAGLVVVVCFYFVGRSLCSRGHLDIGTKFHVLVHWVGGSFNAFIYVAIYHYVGGTASFW